MQPWGSPVFLAHFNGADNTSLASYTPDMGTTGAAGQGTFKLLSNQATPNTSNNGDIFVYDAGFYDFTLTCSVTGYCNSTPFQISGALLCFRYTDINNYWWWYWEQRSGVASNFQLLRHQAGVDTAVVMMELDTTSGSTHAVQVTCRGPTITIGIDGTEQINYTGATFNQAATKFGLYLAFSSGVGNNAKWKDLQLSADTSVTPPVTQGPPMLGAPWVTVLKPEFTGGILVPPPPMAGIQTLTPEITGGPPVYGAPWNLHQPIENAPPLPLPPVVIKTSPSTPEITTGPPIYGSPWNVRIPFEKAVLSLAPPPVVIPVTNPVPEVRLGPPMVGAPWVGVVPITSLPLGAAQTGTIGPPPPPPHPEFPSHNRPFIARIVGDGQTKEDRLRRFSETLTNCFNSLVGQGYIMQLGSAKYQIIGGAFTAGRNPGPTDDLGIGVNPGSPWINTMTGGVFMNLTNGPASATWAQLSGGGGGGGGGSGLTGTFP